MVKNRKLSRAISETRLENIQNVSRMDLRKNMVMISEGSAVGSPHLKFALVVDLKVEN